MQLLIHTYMTSFIHIVHFAMHTCVLHCDCHCVCVSCVIQTLCLPHILLNISHSSSNAFLQLLSNSINNSFSYTICHSWLNLLYHVCIHAFIDGIAHLYNKHLYMHISINSSNYITVSNSIHIYVIHSIIQYFTHVLKCSCNQMCVFSTAHSISCSCVL